MLKKLHLKGVGPAPEMEVEFAERLTVITGDNGLGKSFILDAVWFALTEEPFGEDILVKAPEKNEPTEEQPSISLVYAEGAKKILKFHHRGLAWASENGQSRTDFPNIGGPLIYLGTENNIAIYDPIRPANKTALCSIYTPDEIRNGTPETPFNLNNINANISGVFFRENRIKINGYLIDLTNWLHEKQEPYTEIQRILIILSEDVQNPLALTIARRIPNLQQPKMIPHLNTEMGEVPVTLTSAGILKILSLAYMIVNCWQEHKFAANIQGIEHSKALVLLIDEIETHLHPKWQRKILAAVLEVAKAITDDEGFQVQVICTTHSPIVLTGIEPHFDPAIDKLLDLQLTPGAHGEPGTVELREVDWYKRGTVGNWLTSDMFNVSERSPEAEAALEAAAVFGDPLRPDTKPDRSELQKVDRALRDTLADTDRFLLRWEYLLEQRGWTSLLRGK